MTNCQKDDLNGASGQVIDAATLEGVPNVQVILYLAETPVFGPTQVTFLEEVTTDNEGYYSFDFKTSGKENYEVHVNAETYFQSRNSFPREKIVEMTPESIVQLHLKIFPLHIVWIKSLLITPLKEEEEAHFLEKLIP